MRPATWAPAGGGPAQKQLSSIPFSKPKSRPSSSEMVPLACSRVKNPGRFPAATTVCWVASRACHTRTPAYGEARPTGRAPNLPRSAAVAARWAAAVVVRGGLRDAGAGPTPAAAGSTGSPTDAAVPGIAAGCRGAIAAAGSTTTCRTCPGSGWMTMHKGSGAAAAPWEAIGRWGCITGGEGRDCARQPWNQNELRTWLETDHKQRSEREAGKQPQRNARTTTRGAQQGGVHTERSAPEHASSSSG